MSILARNRVCFHGKSHVQAPNVDILNKGEKTDMVTEFKYLGSIMDPNHNLKNVKKK